MSDNVPPPLQALIDRVLANGQLDPDLGQIPGTVREPCRLLRQQIVQFIDRSIQ